MAGWERREVTALTAVWVRRIWGPGVGTARPGNIFAGTKFRLNDHWGQAEGNRDTRHVSKVLTHPKKKTETKCLETVALFWSLRRVSRRNVQITAARVTRRKCLWNDPQNLVIRVLQRCRRCSCSSRNILALCVGFPCLLCLFQCLKAVSHVFLRRSFPHFAHTWPSALPFPWSLPWRSLGGVLLGFCWFHLRALWHWQNASLAAETSVWGIRQSHKVQDQASREGVAPFQFPTARSLQEFLSPCAPEHCRDEGEILCQGWSTNAVFCAWFSPSVVPRLRSSCLCRLSPGVGWIGSTQCHRHWKKQSACSSSLICSWSLFEVSVPPFPATACFHFWFLAQTLTPMSRHQWQCEPWRCLHPGISSSSPHRGVFWKLSVHHWAVWGRILHSQVSFEDHVSVSGTRLQQAVHSLQTTFSQFCTDPGPPVHAPWWCCLHCVHFWVCQGVVDQSQHPVLSWTSCATFALMTHSSCCHQKLVWVLRRTLQESVQTWQGISSLFSAPRNDPWEGNAHLRISQPKWMQHAPPTPTTQCSLFPWNTLFKLLQQDDWSTFWQRQLQVSTYLRRRSGMLCDIDPIFAADSAAHSSHGDEQWTWRAHEHICKNKFLEKKHVQGEKSMRKDFWNMPRKSSAKCGVSLLRINGPSLKFKMWLIEWIESYVMRFATNFCLFWPLPLKLNCVELSRRPRRNSK